jgi:membrane protein DedA with SNARE-associated domain
MAAPGLDDPERAVIMLHWLHSFLPHIPHYGYVLVFIVVFLNQLGVPLPGETILLGAGFVLGKTSDSLWPPVMAGAAAAFLGGLCAFGLGRRLGRGGLEKIHWLHLTHERLQWPERFFKRHGARTVFIARFIFLFPPVATNLLAGMAKMSWRTYLSYNLAGSVAYATSYILLGYYFGKRWKRFAAGLGSTTTYLLLAGALLVVLGLIFRHSLSGYWKRHYSKPRQQK